MEARLVGTVENVCWDGGVGVIWVNSDMEMCGE